MDSSAISLGTQALQVAGIVLGPILIIIAIIGIVIGFIQAVTQIQDMTISFVVKLFAVAVILYFIGPWALNFLATFLKNAYMMPLP